jgi:hypothetical protein
LGNIEKKNEKTWGGIVDWFDLVMRHRCTVAMGKDKASALTPRPDKKGWR